MFIFCLLSNTQGVIIMILIMCYDLFKVLDYLILSGRLCDRGFDASAVEECLDMYQCSEEKVCTV